MIPDLNLAGVTADDLIDLLDGLKEVAKPLDRMREAAPCVGPSKITAGCVDATEGLGTVVDELTKWFTRQEGRVFAALLDTPEPDVVMVDYRSYAILAHMAERSEPLESIAELALRFSREDKAAWETARAKTANLHERFKREQRAEMARQGGERA
jgi:hypothetical protein